MTTFKLIAKNVAYYYKYIKQNKSSILSNEEQFLAVVGILDAWAYIDMGQIGIDEIISIASRSRLNSITLFPHSIHIYEGLSQLDAPDNQLLNFTLSLEALLFSIDNPRMDPRIILEVVKTKKDLIEKTLSRTLKKEVPSRIRNFSDKCFSAIDISGIKLQLK